MVRVSSAVSPALQTVLLFVVVGIVKATTIQPIHGGEEVVPGKYKFMAAMTNVLGVQRVLKCGATVVAPNVLLTAAHCVTEGGPPDLKVLLGAHNLRDANEAGREAFPVYRVFIHPGWQPRHCVQPGQCEEQDFNYDAAVVVLRRDLDTNKYPPIKLDTTTASPRSFDFKNLTAIGWGDTYNRPIDGRTGLREVTVAGIHKDDCNKPESYNGQVSDNMICAAAPSKDTCTGDSGGPLFHEVDGEIVQVGIVSWGRGGTCGNPLYPGVFTFVPRITSFVQEIIDEYPSGLDHPDIPCSCRGGAVPGDSCGPWGGDENFCFVLGGAQCRDARYSPAHQRWFITGCRPEAWFGEYDVNARRTMDDIANEVGLYITKEEKVGWAKAITLETLLPGIIGVVVAIAGIVGFTVVIRHGQRLPQTAHDGPDVDRFGSTTLSSTKGDKFAMFRVDSTVDSSE